MPPRSKVSTLPPEVKTWLDQALVENNFSDYESLSEELAERGYRISRSSLHRYGQGFEDKLAALRLASEQARAIVTTAPDDEGTVNEALLRMVQEQLFQLLKDGGDVDLPKVARAVADLGRASVVQKKWQVEARAKAEAAAERVEKIARKGGLDADTVSTIRRTILGVAQ